MLEFIVCLTAVLFLAAALLGSIKFWMRLEELEDRIEYETKTVDASFESLEQRLKNIETRGSRSKAAKTVSAE